VTLPIKTLPIVERWDCTGCGKCCRGNVVPLDDDDLARLRQQRWDQHPDYRGAPTMVRQGLLSRRYQLAQRDDGTCVFLTEEGLCRIHQEFGFESKPLVCRMYPLQLVPVQDTAFLTLRRSCPTAAAEQGREMRAHRDVAKAFVKERPRLAEAVAPPAIYGGYRRSWKDTLLIMRGIERLLTDQRFPLVRRIAHGLRYCDLLEHCKLKRVDSSKLRELIDILVENCPEEATVLFREAAEPVKFSAVLFRQAAAEYLRLQPGYIAHESWRQRLRMTSVAMAFARGRGAIPRLHESYPETSFEQVESRRLGHLEEHLQAPLVRYFEATAVSKQYAMAGRPRWSLIEKYRALALAYPVAMWTLRYICGDEAPTVQRVIDMVTAIDRGQGFGPLDGRQHRRRISHLAQLDALDRLVIWYAR
jgi:lysine-N-methylase